MGCVSINLVSLAGGVQVDMYSFGVILWELITTEVPRRGRLRAIKASTVPCMLHACYHGSFQQACHWYTATTLYGKYVCLRCCFANLYCRIFIAKSWHMSIASFGISLAPKRYSADRTCSAVNWSVRSLESCNNAEGAQEAMVCAGAAGVPC